MQRKTSKSALSAVGSPWTASFLATGLGYSVITEDDGIWVFAWLILVAVPFVSSPMSQFAALVIPIAGDQVTNDIAMALRTHAARGRNQNPICVRADSACGAG